MSTTGYDLSKFNLPLAKAQPGPAKGNSTSSAPAGGYDLRVFKLPPAGEASHSGTRTSSAPASGYNLAIFDLPEKIEIPARSVDGRERTEKIHIRDFGKHIRARVQDALDRGKPGDAAAALHWQIGVAQGSKLMSGPTLERFQKLGTDFGASKNPQAYFQKNLIPFLNNLKPAKRGENHE
jgi:hypothetical protein